MERKILLSDENKLLIKYVRMGLTNIEIGEELGYSYHTIKKDCVIFTNYFMLMVELIL